LIYTVTANPAVDYTIFIQDLKIGKVNKAQKEAILYGGKGINVSIVLKNLGISSTALGFTAGFTGQAIEDGVSALGIKTDFIRLRSGTNRINIKIRSAEETDINGHGPDIPDDAINELLAKTEKAGDGDILILSGSVPDNCPHDLYERIMEKIRKRDVKVIVDATKDLLLNTLKYEPFLIKPNEYELGDLFGKNIESDEEITLYARKLQEKGARNVLVSLGQKGAVLFTETGELFRQAAPIGTVVNTVGAGDSMVAGFIAGYLDRNDYIYALKMGVAAGSASAFSLGLAKKEMIDTALNKIWFD
jgi:1-phosphofructokinase